MIVYVCLGGREAFEQTCRAEQTKCSLQENRYTIDILDEDFQQRGCKGKIQY